MAADDLARDVGRQVDGSGDEALGQPGDLPEIVAARVLDVALYVQPQPVRLAEVDREIGGDGGRGRERDLDVGEVDGAPPQGDLSAHARQQSRIRSRPGVGGGLEPEARLPPDAGRTRGALMLRVLIRSRSRFQSDRDPRRRMELVQDLRNHRQASPDGGCHLRLAALRGGLHDDVGVLDGPAQDRVVEVVDVHEEAAGDRLVALVLALREEQLPQEGQSGYGLCIHVARELLHTDEVRGAVDGDGELREILSAPAPGRIADLESICGPRGVEAAPQHLVVLIQGYGDVGDLQAHEEVARETAELAARECLPSREQGGATDSQPVDGSRLELAKPGEDVVEALFRELRDDRSYVLDGDAADLDLEVRLRLSSHRSLDVALQAEGHPGSRQLGIEHAGRPRLDLEPRVEASHWQVDVDRLPIQDEGRCQLGQARLHHHVLESRLGGLEADRAPERAIDVRVSGEPLHVTIQHVEVQVLDAEHQLHLSVPNRSGPRYRARSPSGTHERSR